MALTKQYFSLFNEYKNKYGEKTFLLMQVGSFYEFYSMKENDPHIQAFTTICDLKIAQKGDNHYMAGFRDYVLDKYLAKLNDSDYTTVVYIQEETEPGVFKRKEYGIFSPGTTFLDDDIKLTNNISCLWIYKQKIRSVSPGIIIFGISNIDIYTGKVDVFEYEQLYYHNPTTYDDIERYMSIYSPNELVVVHNIEDNILDGILQYINFKSKKITKVNLNNPVCPFAENALKCESQVFQNEIIQKFYPALNKNLVMNNLFDKAIAFQSLCFLLDFVSQHNVSLARNLEEPCLDKNFNYLALANHSLKQLNIIDSGDYQGQCSSVLKLLNTCKTKVGKREFQRVLLNPSYNIEQLNESYDITEHCLTKGYNWNEYLPNLCDIEKIHRKIVLERATPCEYYQLYNTCKIINEISLAFTDDILYKYIHIPETLLETNKIMYQLDQFINIEIAKNTNELNESCENLILRGIDYDLDKSCKEKMECRDKFDSILKFLNHTYSELDKKCTDGFKIHETDRSGLSIHITKKRWTTFKSSLTRLKNITLQFYSKYSKTTDAFTFDTTKLEVLDYNSSTYTITSKELNDLSHSILSTTFQFEQNLKRVYSTIHSRLNVSYSSLIYTIRHLDVLNTKCENAIRFNYKKPKIDETTDKSYFNAKGVRHALIEHLDKQETYVTNDLCLGEKEKDIGLLLYGTNAVGKTSLIKAIGIIIIMAQAGLYVPCSSFVYHPYRYLFTRIIGNDNIFKGLSTFAVEMSELRVILQQCNQNSLILGDELCSGTEIDSALSIFVSGLETMYEKESTFIFATHFHSIQSFDEVTKMERLSMKHLSVKYNYELKQLVYDRKLHDGAGESVYGLEVCKSLNLPDTFLSRAYEIRNKYNVVTSSVLTLPTTKYNRDKIRGICEFCKKNMGTETHHLEYQKNAVNGHIEGVPVDHVANLASICESCHKNIHQLGLVYEKRKTIDGKYSLILKVKNI
jgi:DNA mismatch repair protein MutS